MGKEFNNSKLIDTDKLIDYEEVARIAHEHHLSDDGLNTYKVILQLRDDGWAMVASPKLVYSYLDYPNLPRDVIFRANH